jgi:hypothetical protein
VAENQKYKHILMVTSLQSRMPSSGMLRCITLVRTDVLEECSASIIRVTKIGEVGTMLAVTSNDACSEGMLCEKGSVSMEYQIEDAERSKGSR